MTRRAYIYFALTFLFGVLVGAAGMFATAWYWGRWHRGFDKHHIVHRMKRELRLSDEQVEQVKQIFDEFGGRVAELREKVRPQFDALRQESQARVRAVLTPEQQLKYEEMIRRDEERMKRRRPR